MIKDTCLLQSRAWFCLLHGGLDMIMMQRWLVVDGDMVGLGILDANGEWAKDQRE